MAVSLDTVKSDWKIFVEKNNLNWFNVCDTQGWNGKAAIEYYIYATPAMFLVDEKGLLIKIVNDIEELNKYLK